MKQRLLCSLGLSIVVASVSAGMFYQKIGRTTKAKVEAVLPASLRVKERPDPAGEARYAKLVKLAGGLKDPDIGKGLGRSATLAERALLSRVVARHRFTLAEAERLLKGSLHMPSGASMNFPAAASIKGLSRLVSMATADAARRKDFRGTERYGALGLQLGKRYLGVGGQMVDYLAGQAVEAIGQRAVYEAEMDGALDAKARVAVLAFLAPLKGTEPGLDGAIRRDFQRNLLPTIVDPTYGKTLTGQEVGNFDPLATARLIGSIYDAAIADTRRSFYLQTGLAARLAASAAQGVPDEDAPGMTKAKYKARMKAIPNSVGRQFAAIGVPSALGRVGARRAADRNLVRAVLLLRMGKTPHLVDPFTPAELKVDAKRRIVYSVGQNQRDDGGRFTKMGSPKEPDFGYPY